jgi:exopolysaccharide biosynthesis polyprenyl glycosylphosphotransferase
MHDYPPTDTSSTRHPESGSVFQLRFQQYSGDSYLLPLVLLACSDIFVLAGSLWIGYCIRFHTPFTNLWPVREGWETPGFAGFFQVGILVAFLGLILFERMGFYRHRSGLSRNIHWVKIALGILAVHFLLQLYFYMTDTNLSRLARIIGMLLAYPMALMAHAFCQKIQPLMMHRGVGFKRCLVFTDQPESVPRLSDEISRIFGTEYQIKGYITPTEPITSYILPGVNMPVYEGEFCDLRRTLASGHYDVVLIRVSDHYSHEVLQTIALCRVFKIDFLLEPQMFEGLLKNIAVGGGMSFPVLGFEETPLYGSAVVLKRLFDLLVSGILIIILFPFWLILAILIRLESKGPVIYRQERIGHDGRTFNILKFRTMRVDAEATSGPVWAVQDDPRRTLLGGWLRRLNIDETPQLINVFRGEMSLVGPRPERPFFVDQFKHQIPAYQRRHMVRCGMTGWAQIHGFRGDTSIEERTLYDRWYIEHWSFSLDIRILLRTLISTENAH